VKTTTDSKPAEPVVTHEDPAGIETGLAYDELVRRFGPGSMSITMGPEKSMTYRGKDGTFRVKVKDGAVASVDKPQ
jgi:hypothetical protein